MVMAVDSDESKRWMAADDVEYEISKVYAEACNKLTPSDIGKLKFLFADKLKVNALFNAKEACNIFLLCDRPLRTLEFLSVLLQLLKRNDILIQVDNRRSTLSHSSKPSSSIPHVIPSQLISNRRLHLFRLVDEKQLHKGNLSSLVLFHSLNPDFADCEWPYVLEELLHMKLLDQDAGEAAVKKWIEKHIDAGIAYAEPAGLSARIGYPATSTKVTLRGNDEAGESTDAEQECWNITTSVPGEADQSDQPDGTQAPEDSFADESSCSIPAVSQVIMEGSYSPHDLLGHGQSADVYRGLCPQSLLQKYGQLPVAVKVLKHTGFLGKKWNKQFFQELLATHALRSPYLLPLFCYTAIPSRQVVTKVPDERMPYYAFMFPLMSGGTLFKRLFDGNAQSSRGELSWSSRVRIAYQIAVALQTMHSSVTGRRQPIVHRDMKSDNILLDELDNAKLADTGLSRELLQDKSLCTTSNGGTIGYSHPDTGHGPYFMHYDWFSFGFVLLELVLGKPACSQNGTLQLQVKEEKSKMHHVHHKNIDVKQGEEIRNEYSQCWRNGEGGLDAADRLLYVAVHCISAMNGTFDDFHRKQWLGLNTSGWTELKPVALLNKVCTSNSIPLYTFTEVDSADNGSINSKRCIACFAKMNKGANGLHTMSALCSPDECSWYCFDCMQSQEPVFCLKHGTAQPIIGGKNAYVIAVSGKGKGAEIYEKACKRLETTLTDYRFAGLSYGSISVIPKPSDNKVHLKLLHIILQLEQKVIETSCTRALDKFKSRFRTLQLQTEPLRTAVANVCTFVRKKVATDSLLKKTSDEVYDGMFAGLSVHERKKYLALLVEVAWNIVNDSEPDLEKRALQIVKWFNLWRDYTKNESPGTELKILKNEKSNLDGLVKAQRCKDPNLREEDFVLLMHKCFKELISTCCLPVSVTAVEENDLRNCICNLQIHTGEKDLLQAGRYIVDSLRPLSDGLVWYHYCGHATGNGGDSLDDQVLPKALLQVAGRLVTNLIVTIDCCHADANKPSIEFCVDEKAPYSSYTTVVSCTAKEQSYYDSSTAFGEFLISGLRSAIDDCQLAFNRCFRKTTCNKCRACKRHQEPGGQCEICYKYRSSTNGFRTLAQIFEYIRDHVCTERMHPLITPSVIKRHLPIVYSHFNAPTYKVRLNLPVPGEAYERMERTIELDELPRVLLEISLFLMREALVIIRKLIESSGKQPWCPKLCFLVGCETPGFYHGKCIDAALQHFENYIQAKKSLTKPIDRDYQPQESNEDVSSECIVWTDERVAKMLSFYNIIGQIRSVEDITKSFRRGLDVLCVMELW